jgi:hypothetical protein
MWSPLRDEFFLRLQVVESCTPYHLILVDGFQYRIDGR